MQSYRAGLSALLSCKKVCTAGSQSHSYGMSLAIWDHTVLPSTRNKWARPALTPASKLVLDLPTPEGLKADGRLPGNATAEVEHATSRSQIQRCNHYTTDPPSFS